MTASVQANHFNLHVNGVGYLNRVRWVEPKRNAGRRAEPFLACSVSALRGNAEQPDYTYFDLRVSGREAIEMVDRLGEDVAAQRKVFISFRVGDIYPHVYERDVKDRQTGRKTGEKEMAALIKGRLLLINSITIDGENVYRRDPDAAAPEDDAPAGNSEEYGEEQGDEAAPEPQAQPRRAQAQPERPTRQAGSYARAQPTARQPEARSNDQRPAYQGGYVAGRATRQGADRVGRAMA